MFKRYTLTGCISCLSAWRSDEMSTREWFPLFFVLFSFAFFLFAVDFRWLGILFLPLVYSFLLSRDEWRLGRVMLQTTVFILIGLVLFFSFSYIATAIAFSSTLRGPLVFRSAVAFFFLLFLTLGVGIPVSWVGVQLRKRLQNFPGSLH